MISNGNSAETVDDYIDSFSGEVKEKLLRLRKLVKQEVPEADEKISYKMAAYKYKGKVLVYFAGFADHVGLYPVVGDMEKNVPGVSEYKSGKGTLWLPLEKELPERLIKDVIKYRKQSVDKKLVKKRA